MEIEVYVKEVSIKRKICFSVQIENREIFDLLHDEIRDNWHELFQIIQGSVSWEDHANWKIWMDMENEEAFVKFIDDFLQKHYSDTKNILIDKSIPSLGVKILRKMKILATLFR